MVKIKDIFSFASIKTFFYTSILFTCIDWVIAKLCLKEFFWNIAWDYIKYFFKISDEQEDVVFASLTPHIFIAFGTCIIVWLVYNHGKTQAGLQDKKSLNQEPSTPLEKF